MKSICQDVNVRIAKQYYRAMLNKHFDEMASYLDANVMFVSPLTHMHGRDKVIASARTLSEKLDDIKIRAQFGADDQIMFAYDFIFQAPIGRLRSAVLMRLTDQRISEIELFFNAMPFIGTR